jgi:hypothetical protein
MKVFESNSELSEIIAALKHLVTNGSFLQESTCIAVNDALKKVFFSFFPSNFSYFSYMFYLLGTAKVISLSIL